MLPHSNSCELTVKLFGLVSIVEIIRWVAGTMPQDSGHIGEFRSRKMEKNRGKYEEIWFEIHDVDYLFYLNI